MPVSWTNYRFTPPKVITEGQFQVARNRPKTHRYITFDNLWQMFQDLVKNARVPGGIAFVALVVGMLLPEAKGAIFSFVVLVGAGCTISVVFTFLSFVLFAFHYAYYWQRVAVTVTFPHL